MASVAPIKRGSTARELLEGIKVIDVDTHVSEAHDLWTSRAPANLKDVVPRVVGGGDERAWIIGDDIVLGRPSASSAVSPTGEKLRGLHFARREIPEVHAGSWEVGARVKVMDEQGIYAQIAYPNVLGFGGQRAMTQADTILHYIADSHPERDLGADAGVHAHFEFNEAMSFLTGDFHPAFWPFFRPERFTTSEDAASIEAVRAATQPRVDRVLTYLDGQIGGTGHVYRAKRTVADAYAFVMTRWSQRFPKTWRDYPNVAGFMQAMETDAAVMQVLERSSR